MMRLPSGESAVHLRLIARLALVLAVTASVALVALLQVVEVDQGHAYGAIIGSRLRAQARLDVTLWSFGLLIAALSGLATWLLALLASFRFAGPIWRFSRNLELAIRHGPVLPQPLRRDDLLQAESLQMLAAVEALQTGYRQLELSLAQWREEPTPQAVQAVLSRLQECCGRARF